jgi:hypothetical protein
LNLAHYHLHQLVSAELVEVTREQKRAGRPIRFYRSRYNEYFIPFPLLHSRPAEKLARSLATSLENSRDRSGAGVLFDVDDSGRSRMREIAGAGAPPLEIWRRLLLSRKEAQALFAELVSAVHRYEDSQSSKRPGWIIHLALGETRK